MVSLGRQHSGFVQGREKDVIGHACQQSSG